MSNQIKKVKVLTIGSSPSVKGGITTVINQFMTYNWNDITMSLLPTYIEGNKIKQILFFMFAVLKYSMTLIFNRPDIVHIHMSYKGSFHRKLFITKLSRKFKVKVILHLHGSEFKLFYENSDAKMKGKIRGLFEMVDQTVVLGQNWKDFIQQIAPNSNIVVCNNTVELPSTTIKHPSEQFNILFLAVLLKRKGIYDLLESINQLNQEQFFKQKNVKFIIGGDGPEYESVLKYVKDHNLDSVIEMVGWVDGDKKKELLITSHAMILPSYNEGLPMSILEAMSYGIPVISTDVGSISEVVINKKTGILIESGNVDQIKQSIKTVVTEKELWELISHNSRDLIKQKYNQQQYLENFEIMYQRLITL